MKNFDKLLKKYGNTLKSASKRYAYKYIFIDSEDLYQEGLIVLLLLLRKKEGMSDDTIKEELNLRIRRSFQNYINKEKYIAYHSVSLNKPVAEGIKIQDTLAGEKDVDVNVILFHVYELSFSERVVFKKRMEGFTKKEIGYFLNCDIKTVYRIIKRIQEKLKNFN